MPLDATLPAVNLVKRLVVLAVLASASLVRGETSKDAGAAAFDKLKALAGDWEATAPTGIQNAHFELIADNSVVSSRLSGGMPHDMHTMFHMDGRDLMLTHYCAMHNQPRMVLLSSDDPKKLVFKFKDGTNIGPGDGHMNQVAFIIDGPNRHVEEWTYLAKGKETTTRCEFRRKP
ncbi:MAG: hypothetical protein ABR611_06360 [Chthoniobacterales bacterium]